MIQLSLSSSELEKCPKFMLMLEELNRDCLGPNDSLSLLNAYKEKNEAQNRLSENRKEYLKSLLIIDIINEIIEEFFHIKSELHDELQFDLEEAFSKFGLSESPQTYIALERKMMVAEASRRLKLPSFSSSEKENIVDKNVIEDEKYSNSNSETENISNEHASSFSSSPSPSHTNILSISEDVLEEKFLSDELLMQENSIRTCIEKRIEKKFEQINSMYRICFEENQFISSSSNTNSISRNISFSILEVQKMKSRIKNSLEIFNRMFTEFCSILETMIYMIIQTVTENKLIQKYEYDNLFCEWLCVRCSAMNLKLKALDWQILKQTYNSETVPALNVIKDHMHENLKAVEGKYSAEKALLREYENLGVEFHQLCEEYQKYVKILERIEWTINELEQESLK